MERTNELIAGDAAAGFDVRLDLLGMGLEVVAGEADDVDLRAPLLRDEVARRQHRRPAVGAKVDHPSLALVGLCHRRPLNRVQVVEVVTDGVHAAPVAPELLLHVRFALGADLRREGGGRDAVVDHGIGDRRECRREVDDLLLRGLIMTYRVSGVGELHGAQASIGSRLCSRERRRGARSHRRTALEIPP